MLERQFNVGSLILVKRNENDALLSEAPGTKFCIS